MFQRSFASVRRTLLLAAARLLPLVLLVHPVGADDRDLLRDQAARPYVFIALDTSGSMHWQIGNTLPLARADSPESKAYQAKEALYEVVRQIDFVQFGFGTFNQDKLRVVNKHWIYEAEADGPLFASGTPYPAVGDQHVFGRTWACDEYWQDATLGRTGCAAATPADLTDDWSRRRMEYFSKLDDDGDDPTSFFVLEGGEVYEVSFDRTLGNGDPGDAAILGRVTIRGVDNGHVDQANIRFNLVQGFLAWEPGDTKETEKPDEEEGFFTGFATGSGNTEFVVSGDMIADMRPNNSTCRGWEDNGDTSDDDDGGINLKYPTTGSGVTAIGDVIPFHWDAGQSNQNAILNRLAPNRLLGEPTPNFGLADYFADHPSSGRLDLDPALRGADGRVIVPWGETPLNGTVQFFRLWYKDWRPVAIANDPDWECRSKFLILLTDGNENCASSVEGQTTSLFNQGVRTFVVGFGVPDTGEEDTLDKIADRGGTGEPYRPQSPEELVDALLEVFGKIREESSAFASAAVPSVQANVADKLYLSSFTPLNDTPYWDGHLDSYLKPLPLTDAGLPDRDRVCGPTDGAACRAWDAGEEILDQAPEEVEDPITLVKSLVGGARLGGDTDERRVIYPVAGTSVPLEQKLFWLDKTAIVTPEEQAQWLDLLRGLGILGAADPLPADPADLDAALDEAETTMRTTLKIKHDVIETVDVDGNPVMVPVDYVVGDIFHSDPLVATNPNNFFYFNADLYSNGELCDSEVDPNPGYRCFFEKHRNRRKFVLVGSNDGQLHAFDAGVLRETDTGDEILRDFDNGTGREIFSIISRSLLPQVNDMATSNRHRFTLDSPPVLADVFLDPAHNGTPTPADREWRTVAFNALREGGRAVFAYDITQPDVLGTGLDTSREVLNIPRPLAADTGDADQAVDFVPSCWDGNPADFDAATEIGCGPSAFPQVLWEFTDTSDEDLNGGPDLGDTWSVPNVGLIKVQDANGDVVDKFVAIFGGGVDPDALGLVGNWLYMVDVETGQVLYKRVLEGAAPSEPAALDTNNDLYTDTIYIGTTSGFIYKVDLSAVVELDADGRILATETAWNPFKVFDTGGRPIYFPPSVFFVADKGSFGLAFGTGDRENLWSADLSGSGRFYSILDSGFSALDPPLTESALTAVSLTAADAASSTLAEQGGWYFSLDPGERLITKTITVTGITFFNTFIPQGGAVVGGEVSCARFGDSRIFIVGAVNGNGFAPPSVDPSDPCGGRCSVVPKFVTNAFLEPSTTKNPVTSGSGTNNADTLDERMQAVLESLKDLFPKQCRYSNHTQNLKTIRSDTGVVFIAPIPTCIIPHNWSGN